jgi:hypothetical protein
MFDYYKYRFGILKGWTPEFGYELMAPAAIFGAVLILSILYLTSPKFGFLMWASDVPLPAEFSFGLVLVLLIATYFADELKRPGLWLVVGICGAALIASIPLTFELSERYAQGIYDGMNEEPSAVLVGAAFAAYLLLMLGLTVSRLHRSNDR